jgi:hypothetical protein
LKNLKLPNFQTSGRRGRKGYAKVAKGRQKVKKLSKGQLKITQEFIIKFFLSFFYSFLPFASSG